MHTTPITINRAGARRPALTPVERRLLDGMNGQPFQASDYTPQLLASAKATFKAAGNAVGFENPNWFTTEKTNAKLATVNLPTIGVTLHAARSAAGAWESMSRSTRRQLAAAFGVTVDDITSTLGLTVCPRATKICKLVCIVAKSYWARFDNSVKSRLVRTLMTLLRPAEACALTLEGLLDLEAKHGFTGARWRTNVADDIRWERVAPGLFGHVQAYAYTKFSPADRPNNFPGMSIVYSATERTTQHHVRNILATGERVALVLDVPKDKVPTMWHGMPVVNGDATDDLWSHPAGHIVGLAAKGTKAQKAVMRASGFAHQP